MKATTVSKPSSSFRQQSVKKAVSETAYLSLKQENKRLKDQIESYKATWMRKLIY